MPDDKKTQEFLQKLAPCIERGDLDACVEEAARVAREMGVGAEKLLDLSNAQEYNERNHKFAYVLALATARGLKGKETARAYFIAGRAAKDIGKQKDSEEYYKKAINADPEYARAHYNYANLLYELGRKDEAGQQYLKAIEAEPKDELAHNNYANLLQELNRKEEAEEHYKKAIEAEPKHALAHNNYANLLQELNRKEEAEEHYKKAIEAEPKHALAHNNYANLLQELNRKEEAEEHYKKAIEAEPKRALAHINYANLLRQNSQLLEAEKEVRIALQIEPENPYALGILGDILTDEGLNFEEAEKAYLKAINNRLPLGDSAISEIHNNLGYVYTQLKQYNKARNEFNKAIALDPLNVKAIRNLRKVGKIGITPEISKIQMCLAVVLLLSLLISFYLFWINRFSETMFATQSSFLIALLVFIFLYHQLARFKAGPFEFEKGTEHRLMEAKSQPSDFER